MGSKQILSMVDWLTYYRQPFISIRDIRFWNFKGTVPMGHVIDGGLQSPLVILCISDWPVAHSNSSAKSSRSSWLQFVALYIHPTSNCCWTTDIVSHMRFWTSFSTGFPNFAAVSKFSDKLYSLHLEDKAAFSKTCRIRNGYLFVRRVFITPP